MATLKFKPFTQSDIATLLKEFKPSGKPTKYKVTSWFDTSNNKILYGIQIQFEKGVWHNMSLGPRAVVFDDESVAKDVVKALINLEKKS